MRIKELYNTSENDVIVRLRDGNSIIVKSHNSVKDIDAKELGDVRKHVKIVQELNEPKFNSGLMQLRD